MTTIYYWCPLTRAYVQQTVPTELAFRLAGVDMTEQLAAHVAYFFMALSGVFVGAVVIAILFAIDAFRKG